MTLRSIPRVMQTTEAEHTTVTIQWHSPDKSSGVAIVFTAGDPASAEFVWHEPPEIFQGQDKPVGGHNYSDTGIPFDLEKGLPDEALGIFVRIMGVV
jgi:hypothetical protein